MAYSEFNYVQPGQLAGFIHGMASVTDEVLAAKFISDAEKLVDVFVGPAPKFYVQLTGSTTAAIASGATAFPSLTWGSRRPNYWAKGGVYVELVDGVPASQVGQSRLIIASTDNQVTLASGFDADLSADATFYFYQRSRFPRLWDQNTLADPMMPDELARITALQVEYAIEFGSEERGLSASSIVDGEQALVQSRTYASGYSESRVPNLKQGVAYLLGPRPRAELRRLINCTGYL